MTRQVLLCLIMLLSPAMVAAETTPADEAIAAYHRGLELQAQDPDAARAQFQTAIERYEQLLGSGHANARLFCNLGHASLLAGDTGRAVLYYRQAERLEPHNAGVRAGLAQVAPRLGKLAPPAARWPNPALVERCLGPWATLLVGLAAFVVGWLSVLLAWRLRRRWLVIVAGPAILGGMLVTGCLVWQGWQEERFPPGVVIQTVSLREGNGPSFRDVTGQELPPGVEFVTLAERDDWLRVQLPDGARGWLPRANTMLVTSPKR